MSDKLKYAWDRDTGQTEMHCYPMNVGGDVHVALCGHVFRGIHTYPLVTKENMCPACIAITEKQAHSTEANKTTRPKKLRKCRIFRVRPYKDAIMLTAEYGVYREAMGFRMRIASFLEHATARDYAAYRNDMLTKYHTDGTTDYTQEGL